jgi:hypothetical protein
MHLLPSFVMQQPRCFTVPFAQHKDHASTDKCTPCAILLLSILFTVHQYVAAPHGPDPSAAAAPIALSRANSVDKQVASAAASDSVSLSESNLQQQHPEPLGDSSSPGSSTTDVTGAEQQQQQQCANEQRQAQIATAAQKFIDCCCYCSW